MTARTPLVLLAAGGTGGHLFPAQALGAALAQRNVQVALATDARAAKFSEHFSQVHVVPSATLRGRDPLSLMRTAGTLLTGTAKAFAILGRVRPDIVVGFGGYPSVPPLLAAWLRGIPTLIHEQNAVMGRANRFLAPRVSAIATGFPGVTDKSPALAAKTTHVGNPIRQVVIAASVTSYDRRAPDGEFRVLVFGGSQGARVMAEIVPPAIALLDEGLRSRLRIVQQAREEDLPGVREAYAAAGVQADVAPFFGDLPARMARAHLVVSRSGASTVAELSAIGRPAILVPLPHALDQDQAANAAILEQAGGAIRLLQSDFTPQRLRTELSGLAGDPQRLADMAESARSAGALDAASQLAELVLKVAGQKG
jgi:UDP-N-acetylglucosamine--N-acetylmuramyl-(pentapeptide) pyrophosphoryl-undecaprenol N-acetylglucosamine transferase